MVLGCDKTGLYGSRVFYDCMSEHSIRPSVSVAYPPMREGIPKRAANRLSVLCHNLIRDTCCS